MHVNKISEIKVVRGSLVQEVHELRVRHAVHDAPEGFDLGVVQLVQGLFRVSCWAKMFWSNSKKLSGVGKPNHACGLGVSLPIYPLLH